MQVSINAGSNHQSDKSPTHQTFLQTQHCTYPHHCN
jgi:hypothetical protein